jgi:ATP-dependent protease Clp ATPase subunit
VPESNLVKQQVALLKTEKVNLSFTDDGIKEIARVAFEVFSLSLSLSLSLSHTHTHTHTHIHTHTHADG